MASLRRGESPGPSWTMTAAQRIWGKGVAQQAAELSAVGCPVMQDSERGAVAQQQTVALVVWPRVGR
eukprot:391094-Alexandrium_andersonii.AAC.1